MSRLVRTAVGAAVTVVAARKAVDRYGPAASRAALGAAARVIVVAQRAAAEFRAGRAEREAELRADLLAGADLTRARTHVDAWRTGRSERADRADGADHADGPERPSTAAGDADVDGRLRPAFAPGVPRPGSAAGAAAGVSTTGPAGSPAGASVAGTSAAGGTRPRAGGSHRAEDRDDGPLGYSFY